MRLTTTLWRRIAPALAIVGLAASVPAHASEYPDKPIRLIVPFGPGGSADNTARLISRELSMSLSQPVVVENRPGADGIIGMRAVASSPPDGYTLLLAVGSSQTLSPLLFKNSPDPVKDFSAISLIATIDMAVVVNANAPYKTFQDYVKFAKAKPSSISSGSSGITLMSEQFKKVIGLPNAVIIPYKGPGLPAVLTGEADLTLDPSNGLELIRAGKLRALAVMSPAPNPALPGVPTLDELGVTGLNFNTWSGLLAPAGTPAPIVEKLNKAVKELLARPDVQERFAVYNYRIVGSTPKEFSDRIKRDIAGWEDMLEGSQIQRN